MNEASISARLTQNIPQDNPSQPPVEEAVDNLPKESAFDSNIELNMQSEGVQLFDYFRTSPIDRYTDEIQMQLREVYRWAAKEARSNELVDVFNKIMELEQQLGISYQGKRLAKLSRWIALDRQTQSIRAQQEMIVRG